MTPSTNAEDGTKDRSGSRSAAVGTPRAALLILVAASLLVVGQILLLALLVDPPFGDGERTVLIASVVAILAVLLYAAGAAWSTLRHIRRAERELATARARLQGIIDASPLGIIAGDLEGRVMLWSAAAERLFGWSAEEVVGRRYPALPDPDDREWDALRRRVKAGETVLDVLARRKRRDGRTLDVSISAAPVRDGRGEITGTIALVADVTQRKASEQERERLEEQLRHAQKMEAIGRLAGGVAHDFNNLLTAIRGHVDLLLSSDGSVEERQDDLEEIGRSADRAAALTRQLLAFSRQSVVERGSLDLNALIREMERLLGRLTGERIGLEMELATDLGRVRADAGQMEQVVMNLAVNAADAMPDGGVITFRTRNTTISPSEAARFSFRVEPGEYVLVSVSDTGTGMEEETAQQIFRPFFTTKPLGIGTGLGLSTVYGIIKQTRGYILVETEPGSGSTFLIYLPRAADAVESTARPVLPERVVGGSETVLVVEDELPVLSLARKVLSRRGYRVLTASRGQEAVRIAREEPNIDLIFCDLGMPDLTGREIVTHVTRLQPDISVLITSGYAEHLVADQGILEGGMPFLSKPYTTEQLAQSVRDVLGANV